MVTVTLQRPNGSLTVQVIDLCASGLAVRVATEVARTFADDLSVDISILLPENPTELKFVATVQHMRREGKGIAMGLMFDKQKSPRFVVNHGHIDEYVTEQQRVPLFETG